jgi:hypothetical protein
MVRVFPRHCALQPAADRRRRPVKVSKQDRMLDHVSIPVADLYRAAAALSSHLRCALAG